jgi:outer membrane biosynthesis protein TonB
MRSHRIVTVAGTVLLGALLLGAPNAVAAPPPDDRDAVTPVVVSPEPPKPGQPDVGTPATDIAVGEPTDPTGEPTDPTDEPAPEPAAQPAAQPTDQPTPAAAPVGRPRPAPAAVPIPARIDTGEGPTSSGPADWWLLGLAALVFLGVAAGGTYRWIRRTERSAR